jgi:hypothetical protein
MAASNIAVLHPPPPLPFPHDHTVPLRASSSFPNSRRPRHGIKAGRTSIYVRCDLGRQLGWWRRRRHGDGPASRDRGGHVQPPRPQIHPRPATGDQPPAARSVGGQLWRLTAYIPLHPLSFSGLSSSGWGRGGC